MLLGRILSYGIQILAKMSLWFVFEYAIEKLGPRTGCDLSKNDRGLIFQKKMTATDTIIFVIMTLLNAAKC